jgi:hypothetical protein
MALLIPLVLWTQPSGAATVSKPTRPASPTIAKPTRPTRPARPVVDARVVINPTIRALVADAASVGVTVHGLIAEWQDVAICEVGGNWSMTGPRYSGIGFSNSTWNAYGGTRYAPLAGQASAIEQIVIGMRVTGGWVPDQAGCNPGGW